MNKVVNLYNLGGFPFTQGTIDFMQSNYDSAFKALGNLIGDKMIISGVIVTDTAVSNGWVSINGEILPFVGGGLATDVFIEETVVQKSFQDNSTHDAYVTRVVKCGSPGDFPFADLKRLSTLKADRWQSGDLKMISCDAAYIAANFDGAGIGINERLGWKIHSALNGRSPIGYDPTDADFAIGNTGGEKAHTLTRSELPHVQINSGMSLNAAGNVNDSSLTDPGPGSTNPIKTDYLGDGTPHNNLHPYKVVLFIEKI